MEYLGSAIAAVAVNYIPSADTTVRLACGVAIAELSKELFRLIGGRVRMPTLFNKPQISISNLTRDGEVNPYFQTIERYISQHAISPPSTELSLEPEGGQLTLVHPRSTSLSATVPIPGSTESMKVSIAPEERQVGGGGGKVVCSKITFTGGTESDLKRIISAAPIQKSRLITIHRLCEIRSDKARKGAELGWETLTVRTNKSLSNVHLSAEVEKTVVKGALDFLDGESEYMRKGLPYQWGCLLYGPPGTGKTSIPKALAADRGLEIFSVGLESQSYFSHAMDLIYSIPSRVKGEKYILLFDDLDLEASLGMYHDKRKNEFAFLQMLDGATEASGRMTFITTTESESFLKWKALMRPGRIDVSAKVDFCDRSQLLRISSAFDIPEAEAEKVIPTVIDKKISPAGFINLLAKKVPLDRIFPSASTSPSTSASTSSDPSSPSDPISPLLALEDAESGIGGRGRGRGGRKKAAKKVSIEDKVEAMVRRYTVERAKVEQELLLSQARLQHDTNLIQALQIEEALREAGEDLADLYRKGYRPPPSSSSPSSPSSSPVSPSEPGNGGAKAEEEKGKEVDI